MEMDVIAAIAGDGVVGDIIPLVQIDEVVANKETGTGRGQLNAPER